MQHYCSHAARPSVHPAVLSKRAVLRDLCNVRSERRMCQGAGLNLAWRWSLRYELTGPVPGPSVLTNARKRFGVATYVRFFARALQLYQDHGMNQGPRMQVDSTLVTANASGKSVHARTFLRQVPDAPAAYLVWSE